MIDLLALVLGTVLLQPAPDGPPVLASVNCAWCHSNTPTASAMRDATGRAIAPFDLWQGSMMAAAARDPLWRAVVSAEIDAVPSRQHEIEATCLRCHAPMADRVGLDDHGTGSLMHVLECDESEGDLARDGVSCTVCHGMSPGNLGTEASYSAGFELDRAGRMFGPHERPFAMPMRHHTGFTPTFGAHVRESALCGSCHTLSTEAFAADGSATGETFLEQAPYLEWRNSAFDTERRDPGPDAASCQSCHAPTTDADGVPISTRIARNPGGRDFPPVRPRQPFGRHLFVGGNTLVLSMLRDGGAELRGMVPASTLQARIDATRALLAEDTARLALERVQLGDGRLAFDVVVENLTGHKLPTAHPTRRVWLSLVVRDARGAVLFAAGVVDEAGRIVGADGRPLPSELSGGPIEPHRDRISRPSDVAQWRAVMADTDGRPTHTLVRGAAWLVDDRLLPRGWSGAHPDAPRTAPVGVEGDVDFLAGSDRVHVDVALGVDGPFTVEARLLHQSLSARWAAELLEHDTPEVEAFGRLYEAADRRPEVLAAARWDS